MDIKKKLFSIVNSIKAKRVGKRIETIKYEEQETDTNKVKRRIGFVVGYIFGLVVLFESLTKIPEKVYIYDHPEIVDDYEDYVEECIKDLDKDMSHLDIFMSLMDHQQSYINGYGEPLLDFPDYKRYDITAGKQGVCRNFADDITYQLKKINPEYNAVNLLVNVNQDNIELQRCNITTKVIGSNTVTGEVKKDLIEKIFDKMHEYKITPNHEVTLVDIPEKEYSIIIDSTNGCIGALLNDEIYILNDMDENMADSFNVTPLFDRGYEKKEHIEVTDELLEELQNEYGVEAQNKSLQRVRKND